MQPPARPKIYHIVHVDRLASIIADGALLCDAVVTAEGRHGTTIGMNRIKARRLHERRLSSRPGLFVGECVPFYFCPRSIMLYLLHRANEPGLAYRDGQEPIVHLEGDMHAAITWAEQNSRRWAFTLSNASAYYAEDRCSLAQLGEINWEAVAADRWSGQGVPPHVKDDKQAEFLIEHSFPWHLVQRIGTRSRHIAQMVADVLHRATQRPAIHVRPDWYY